MGGPSDQLLTIQWGPPPSSEGSISTFTSPPDEPALDPCEALVKQKPKHLTWGDRVEQWLEDSFQILGAKSLETKYVSFKGGSLPAQQPRTTPSHRNEGWTNRRPYFRETYGVFISPDHKAGYFLGGWGSDQFIPFFVSSEQCKKPWLFAVYRGV